MKKKIKIPKELRFKKYTLAQLKKIIRKSPKRYSKMHVTFSKKYDRVYKKYVTNRDLPSSHPFLREIDKWDKQLGRFYDASIWAFNKGIKIMV